MSAYYELSGRQRLQLASMALLLILGVLTVLLVLLPAAALLLLAVGVVAGVSMLARRASTAAELIGRAVRSDPEPAPSAQPTLQLELASGEVLSARAVPLPHPSEHTLVLTRDGYMLIDADGRVLHRLA